MYDIETHPLEPFLPPHTKLLMLGSFPPPKTRWKMEFYYPNFQNDMWKIFGICFFQDKNHFIDLEAKTFKEQEIRDFLREVGVGIYDTAYQVKRLKGNASDKFLEVVRPINLQHLLEKIPDCKHIMTTGEKATETLLSALPEGAIAPSIGHTGFAQLNHQSYTLHRMPSSSRAYPIAVEKKAEFYFEMFKTVGLL